MGSHPANLVLRFLLEVAALVAVGRWGFGLVEQWPRYLLAIALPLSLAVAWGVFAVPGDPSRSGRAPVPVPGVLRLLLEVAFFGFAAWCLNAGGAHGAAVTLSFVTIIHYLLSYDRVSWLLQQ